MEILRPGAENGTLKFLELGDCARIDVEELNWLMDDVNDVEISPNVGLNLEYLGLSGNVTFSDEFSRKFGRLKKLSKIDASRTRISGVGLMNLVNNPRGCVKEMLINGCEVGIDAVELARKKGCVVRWRELGDKLKGGRQVRYRY